MPDYVYALHDFAPEHEDEVPFKQGERIEVIERDDLYSDGWWQGRNLQGRVGLFPESYTTPSAPTTDSALTPAPAPSNPSYTPSSYSEASASASVLPGTGSVLHPLTEEPEPSPPANDSAKALNGHRQSGSGDGEVMKATMTDVQKAIEQLGRNNGTSSSVQGDDHDARSFSFASTRTGGEDLTDREDTDFEMDTDREGDDGEWVGSGDHKDARMKLAEKARKVVEKQRRAREEEERAVGRSVAPPIEVELSDESEGEDDEDHTHHTHHSWTREHTDIPEEDEEKEKDEEAKPQEMHMPGGDLMISTPMEETPLPTATATRTAFPIISPIPTSSPSPIPTGEAEQPEEGTSLPTPTSPKDGPGLFPEPPRTPATNQEKEREWIGANEITPTPSTMLESTHAPSTVGLPTPPSSSIGGQQQTSKHSSLASSHNVEKDVPKEKETKKTHPTEWSVEEVVDWLKSKGFAEDVTDKFIEQEITGDVLLDLDVNLLKSEIGIPAFGKRMRIANAITDLRRPPSIIYSDHPISNSNPHSRTHSQSMQSSLNSPIFPGVGAQYSPVGPLTSAGFGTMMSAESPPHTGDLSPGMPREQRRVSDPISSAGLSVSVTDTDEGVHHNGAVGTGLGVGLGVAAAAGMGMAGKNRPTQLMLSPSDSNLGKTAVSGEIPEEDEERAVMSETEAPSVHKRRRMFGRSTLSDSSTNRHSIASDGTGTPKDKDATSPNSINGKPDDGSVVSRHSRGKRSIDGGKSADRLSLFGGAFNGSIGKSRKPAPRYSSYGDSETPAEKHSSMSLSRLYGGNSRKNSAGRGSTEKPPTDGGSSTTGGSPTEIKATKQRDVKVKSTEKDPKDEKEKDTKENPALLRKRTSSQDGGIPTRGMQALKPGQSILQQIGQPDHVGWMRKKGDRYNSWKQRYFVLKGPHLYILKSESKSETKIKGYVNIIGYKVLADENTDPGRYGFRIVHDTDKTHFFSSSEQGVIREWMKSIMKATIGRDYSRAVVSSCNIPTIPLTVAQAMSPAPRPPSPTARAATQKAHRQENPNQLTSRDARVLMGLSGSENGANGDRPALEQVFDGRGPEQTARGIPPPSSYQQPKSPAPPRPSREMRRSSVASEMNVNSDAQLIDWANSHLPKKLQITDPNGSLCGGLALLRLAESIRGKPSSPPVPDSAFPSGPNDDKLDGLFKLFDFLLDNDVKTGSVSINEVRQGKREKIIQLMRALKAWDDKRQAIQQSIANGPSMAGSPGMSPFVSQWGQAS